MREFYELKFDYADPRLGPFDFKNGEHSYLGNDYLFKDFDNINAGKLTWQPPRLSDVWETQEVVEAVGTVPAFCDYTTIGSTPVLSRRAVAVLSAANDGFWRRCLCHDADGPYGSVLVFPKGQTCGKTAFRIASGRIGSKRFENIVN